MKSAGAALLLIAAMGAAGSDVASLVSRMSLDEKLSLVHGARDPQNLGQAGYWPGLPRLGIPALRLADGPSGVNVNRDATALPAPVGLAATFSVEAARLFGVVLGREAKALQQDLLLAPHLNIVRDPLFRRNHTTFGEDPFLNGRIAAAEISGIQSQGVMAQAKHLAVYNGPDRVVVDERTLREIYLPAFEAAARAGVASMMCAYNRVNGVGSCGNAAVQNGILRGEWGFRGFITSDWGALRSPQAIAQGVDLEMPGREILGRDGPWFTEALKQALERGQIPVSALDDAVTRILTQMDRFGMLGRKSARRPGRIGVEADAAIAREIAEQAAVLLKNDAGLLPLGQQDLSSLAVIGPTAAQLAAGFLGERAWGFESRLIPPLAALKNLAPQAKIVYAVGNDLTGVPPPATNGTFRVAMAGDYTFMVQPAGGEGEIIVDGHSVVRSSEFRGFGAVQRKWSSLLPTADGRDNVRATLRLAAGVHTVETKASGDVRFAWMTPELRKANIDAAVAVAKAAKAAIVFAWHETGSSFGLAEDQDDLIARVAAVNPRTIVVLNTGGPIAMPWKDDVRSILEMWYPGQEGGWATADVLLGRADPAGRLPVTFPVKLEEAPARAAGHPERFAAPAPPGMTGLDPNAPIATFSEGLAIGYRWYDQQRIEPLFAFGHGLSYTRFEYSNLSVVSAAGGADVTFHLRNVGSRRGAEVAQIYLGPAAESAPPRSLAGFARVELKPGETRRVTVRIEAQGRRALYVGASSRDVRLAGAL